MRRIFKAIGIVLAAFVALVAVCLLVLAVWMTYVLYGESKRDQLFSDCKTRYMEANPGEVDRPLAHEFIKACMVGGGYSHRTSMGFCLDYEASTTAPYCWKTWWQR